MRRERNTSAPGTKSSYIGSLRALLNFITISKDHDAGDMNVAKILLDTWAGSLTRDSKCKNMHYIRKCIVIIK